MADAAPIGTLQVELATPEKLLFSGQADMVEAPGAEGDFGVLPQHAPFVSLLRPGIITIHQAGGNKRLFVAGGLAQVDTTQCTILAEQVRDMEGLTLQEVESELAKARQRQDEAASDEAQQSADP